MITIDVPDIKKIEKQLGQYKDTAPNVLSRAINGAAKEARRALAAKAKETYTVKVGGVTKDLKLKSATTSKLYADLNSKGKSIALSKFRVSPAKPAFGSAPIHKAKNITGNSMKNLLKSLGGTEMKGFTAKMKSGHVGVFVRNPGEYMDSYSYPNSGRSKTYDGKPHMRKNVMTKGKSAITQLYGPSMPQMFGSKRVAEKYLKGEIERALYKHVMNEIARVKGGDGK